MNLLLIKATFKPNNPVCTGFIIATVPYSPNVEATKAHMRELADYLGFNNPEPEAIMPLAELSTDLLHAEYLLNWENESMSVVAYVNGEY